MSSDDFLNDRHCLPLQSVGGLRLVVYYRQLTWQCVDQFLLFAKWIP